MSLPAFAYQAGELSPLESKIRKEATLLCGNQTRRAQDLHLRAKLLEQVQQSQGSLYESRCEAEILNAFRWVT